MMDVLWRLSNVTLFGIDRPRLADVTLELRTGTTAILGYSGAGKTSLLNLLVGFEHPDRGQISLERQPTADRMGMFWVPGDHGLWPHLTVREHLLAVSPRGAPAEEAARELLDEFDLRDLENARPPRLSLGERSRLAVARALASEAALLVMDEPLVHVDPARLPRYWDGIRAHRAAAGADLVFATHAPDTVLREADHVVCLKEGRVVFTGSVDELYHRAPSAELAEYLGAANWLSPADAEAWLKQPTSREACYRPERLRAALDSASPLVVQGTRFAGSVTEVELLDERQARRRRFFLRPPQGNVRVGDRVRLEGVS